MYVCVTPFHQSPYKNCSVSRRVGSSGMGIQFPASRPLNAAVDVGLGGVYSTTIRASLTHRDMSSTFSAAK